MKSKDRLFLKITVVGYIVALVYSYYLNTHGLPYLFMVPVSVIVPFILPFVFKLIKIKCTDKIMILNLIFCFFASIVGSTYGGYQWPFYDKIIHGWSGFLLTVVAYVIFCVVKHIRRIDNREDLHLMYIFVNMTNIALSTCWELYEFCMLVFFNNDAIRHYSSGVYDAMTDIISALIGGLILTLFLYASYKKQKSNKITLLYEEVYDAYKDQ